MYTSPHTATTDYAYFDRDVSWLSFNARVLGEAQKESVPLMERIRFLSIFSSNLDEFYRVRMPTLMALHHLGISNRSSTTLSQVNQIIQGQQETFGKIMTQRILPALQQKNIHLLYHEPIPEAIEAQVNAYFFNEVAAFLQVVDLAKTNDFFPANNQLFLAVTVSNRSGEKLFIVNIPSDHISRFFTVTHEGLQFILFLDDVIKHNIGKIFARQQVLSCHSFKITRDAELNLDDEFEGNLARKIEKQIARRDFGLATRFLYEPGLPEEVLSTLQEKLGLKTANIVEGGSYHHLKDLSALPLQDPSICYDRWPAIRYRIQAPLLFEEILHKDLLLHPPYHTYDMVLRFFNEAAIDLHVKKIYISLYRVARDSRIAHALITAARNGKKVTVFVELKARFDEANNIKWAKKMKAAGVKIIYSIPTMKVHAKIAVVKRKAHQKTQYFGLLATGNFNESTASVYTDHILFTAHQEMLREMEQLFRFLKQRKKTPVTPMAFHHLLVAPFNLQQHFMTLIDQEIRHAQQGKKASVTIKLNNLEEKKLINKLYEASQAGVTVTLLVRSICCLIPGVKGMSENIRVQRIVDRYLEHGRIFIFHNEGDPKIFLGSADWMNRNIYRRIEVCFPLYTEALRQEITALIRWQLDDTTQAVLIDDQLNNVPIHAENPSGKVHSQRMIKQALSDKI